MPWLRGQVVQGSVESVCMEEQLERSRERFQTLFNLMPDPVVIVDGKGKFLAVNDKVEEMTGFSKQELLGKSFLRTGIVAAKSKAILVKNLAKRMMGMNIEPYEIEVLSKDGQKILVEVNAKKIEYEGKPADLVIFRDITKRKRAEELYRSVVELSPESIITVDTEGVITSCNNTATRMLGYAKDEIVGKHFSEIGVIPERDLPKYLRLFRSILKGKVTKPLELTFQRKDGTSLIAEVHVGLLKEGGKTVGLQAISREITERRKMEEKLRQSEERFRNLYESIQDPVCVFVGKEGRLAEYNEAFKKSSGYTDEELKDKTFLDFVHPDDHALVLKRYKTKYPEEELPLVYEIRGVNKKGEIIPLEISVSTYKVKGKVVGISVLYRDISKRKKMEEKLRQYSEQLEELVRKRTKELLESEKRYSVLVEEASDGVAIIQDGKIIFVNKKGAEIVGYSRDELIGVPFEELLNEKTRHQAKKIYNGRMQGEKVPATHEIELINKTGERVPVEVSGTLINYQGRPADLAIVRDIRERKRLEEQRLRLEKLAAIGELATMVGHDLRNPLQSIENAAYYLNEELSRLSSTIPVAPKVMEMLQVINDSVDYADKIIRDLHDFSAMKEPMFKKTDLNAIVKDALSQVEIPENVQLITEMSNLPEIEVDKDMMKRVFLNLAVNGIQAMENGGTLRVSTRRTERFVEVSFEDTGIGIPKENMEKLFTPFFTTKAKGIGMGLAICKKLVDVHGGSISVESKEGKGSTFTVKLHIQQ